MGKGEGKMGNRGGEKKEARPESIKTSDFKPIDGSWQTKRSSNTLRVKLRYTWGYLGNAKNTLG